MKVLLTKKFMQTDVEYIKNGLLDGIDIIEPDEYTESSVLEKIDAADVLLGGLITEEVLNRSARIKLFQIPWTGVDNLNFGLLSEYPSVTLCNSHSNSFVVAEHGVALYLAVAKKVVYHDQQMRLGNWNRVSPSGNAVSPFSSSVVNRKVVFIGYGSVNQAVDRLLSGYNPNVTVVNRSGKMAKHKEGVRVFDFHDIHKALDGAQAVFVAAPLTEDTRDLVNAECFSAMNEQTILINVARGTLINEQSLYTSLKEKNIYGAGIDTWYNYPKPGESEHTFPSERYPFQELDNLVMSPHRAGYVDEGFPHLDDAINNINKLKTGKPLVNKITISQRY